MHYVGARLWLALVAMKAGELSRRMKMQGGLFGFKYHTCNAERYHAMHTQEKECQLSRLPRMAGPRDDIFHSRVTCTS